MEIERKYLLPTDFTPPASTSKLVTQGYYTTQGKSVHLRYSKATPFLDIEADTTFSIPITISATRELYRQTHNGTLILDPSSGRLHVPAGFEARFRKVTESHPTSARPQTSYYVTIKHGKGLVRLEVELRIRHTFKMPSLPTLTKTRYKVPVGDYVAEVDFYQGTLSPLKIVEVEFPTLLAAESFSPPSWFGEEVTYDPDYKNANLIKRIS